MSAIQFRAIPEVNSSWNFNSNTRNQRTVTMSSCLVHGWPYILLGVELIRINQISQIQSRAKLISIKTIQNKIELPKRNESNSDARLICDFIEMSSKPERIAIRPSANEALICLKPRSTCLEGPNVKTASVKSRLTGNKDDVDTAQISNKNT